MIKWKIGLIVAFMKIQELERGITKMGYNDDKVTSLLNVNVKLSPNQDKALTMQSNQLGVSKQEIMRKALDLYLADTLVEISRKNLVKVMEGV